MPVVEDNLYLTLLQTDPRYVLTILIPSAICVLMIFVAVLICCRKEKKKIAQQKPEEEEPAVQRIEVQPGTCHVEEEIELQSAKSIDEEVEPQQLSISANELGSLRLQTFHETKSAKETSFENCPAGVSDEPFAEQLFSLRLMSSRNNEQKSLLSPTNKIASPAGPSVVTSESSTEPSPESQSSSSTPSSRKLPSTEQTSRFKKHDKSSGEPKASISERMRAKLLHRHKVPVKSGGAILQRKQTKISMAKIPKTVEQSSAKRASSKIITRKVPPTPSVVVTKSSKQVSNQKEIPSVKRLLPQDANVTQAKKEGKKPASVREKFAKQLPAKSSSLKESKQTRPKSVPLQTSTTADRR